MIHPSKIQRFVSNGTGNMGDVGDTDILRARFKLGCCGSGFALVDLSVRNSGGSAGRANLVMRTDHRLGEKFDFSPLTWKNFGNGAATDKPNIKWVLADWELRSWSFYRDEATHILDELVFEWTNPNTQAWAIEVGLVDLADIPVT